MPKVKNLATGRFLEVDYSLKVHTRAPNEGTLMDAHNQVWHIEPRSDGFYAIINNSTGKALESDHGGKIHVKDKHQNDHSQDWKFEGLLIANRKTGKVLDSNQKGEVYSSQLNGCDYQHWHQA